MPTRSVSLDRDLEEEQSEQRGHTHHQRKEIVPVNRKSLLALLLKYGVPYAEIGAFLGMSRQRVHTLAIEEGLVTPRSAGKLENGAEVIGGGSDGKDEEEGHVNVTPVPEYVMAQAGLMGQSRLVDKGKRRKWGLIAAATKAAYGMLATLHRGEDVDSRAIVLIADYIDQRHLDCQMVVINLDYLRDVIAERYEEECDGGDGTHHGKKS